MWERGGLEMKGSIVNCPLSKSPVSFFILSSRLNSHTTVCLVPHKLLIMLHVLTLQNKIKFSNVITTYSLAYIPNLLISSFLL